jgi:hypothetical protein
MTFHAEEEMDDDRLSMLDVEQGIVTAIPQKVLVADKP